MRKIGKLFLCFNLAIVMAAVFSGCCISHDWVDASCEYPKTCLKCDKTEGTALGHQWIDANCEDPETCKRCFDTRGSALGHNWIEETKTIPKHCTNCEEMIPMATPKNGKVIINTKKAKGSKLTIKSSASDSCYVKLKDSNGKDVMAFFVAAGKTAAVKVPRGNYYVYFAYGDDWYGPEYVFGPNTSYSKDDEIKDFKNYMWEYTLSPVVNGNFDDTPISEDEF